MATTTSDPVWLIAGASAGFGKTIALEALARGYTVVATARSLKNLVALADAGADIRELDVTWPEDRIQAVIDAAVAQHGKLTHIVNAAGYVLEGAVEETTADEVLAQFNTNVFGPINVMRAAIPHLRAQGAGVIANFGSLGSWHGGAAVALYCATKAAMSNLTESLEPELGSFGIKVCVVEPGYFRTEFLNDGRRFSTKKRIPEYDPTPAGEYRRLLDSANNKQPGDPVKAAKAIVDVLTSTGAAKGKEIPVRLVLGPDCLAVVRQKVNETLEVLADFEEISAGTNHDDVQ